MTENLKKKLGLLIVSLIPVVLATGCAFYPPFGPGDGDGGGYAEHRDGGDGGYQNNGDERRHREDD